MGKGVQEAMERWIERRDPVGAVALADRVEARLSEETPAPSWARAACTNRDAAAREVITVGAPRTSVPRRRRSGWVVALVSSPWLLSYQTGSLEEGAQPWVLPQPGWPWVP